VSRASGGAFLNVAIAMGWSEGTESAGATETISDSAGDALGTFTVSAIGATAVTLAVTPTWTVHNPSSAFTASVNGTAFDATNTAEGSVFTTRLSRNAWWARHLHLSIRL
jgi:hypothetical protein